MSDLNDRKKRSCVVPTCYGERFDLVHKFPMETDRTLQWLNALNIPYLYNLPFDKLRSSYFVCSRHFRSQDYKNAISRHLNKTAVPCINLKNLEQIDLVLNRTHPRPTHLTNDPTTITIVEENQIQKSLLKTNRDEMIRNNKENLKRTYSKMNEINENYRNNNTSGNDDDDDDDDDGDDHIQEPESKKSPNLIQLDTQHYTILCTNDDIDNLSSSEADGFTQLIIEGVIDKDEDEHHLREDEKINETITKENSNESKINQYEISEHILVINADDELSLATKDKNCAKNVTMTSKFLKIKHPNYTETLSLDFFWLRDHCRCVLCFNYETKQRRYNLLDIQLDIKPHSTDLKDDKLFVTWDDEHQSEYDIDLLFKSQFDYMKKNVPKQILWDKKRIIDEEYAHVELEKLVTDDRAVEKILKSLITYGIAFIENVPADQDMTEMAIRRLFPIQKTFFGEMWTFSDTQNEDHSDTAYTKDFLDAHTDNTYFYDAAGLQIFHCLEHIDGIGGETFLVDGYKIIQDLMKQNYDAYQKLIEINVPAEYIENGRHHTFSSPVIRLNPETKKPEQIRFNLYDRAILNTLPQNEIHEFYEHFRYLAKLIASKENQWKFKLTPGTILIFDNWRVLHGRESYTGKRKMCGCYVSRTEYLSKARILGLIR